MIQEQPFLPLLILLWNAAYYDSCQSFVEGSGIKLHPLVNPRSGLEVRIRIQVRGRAVLVAEIAGGSSTLGDDVVAVLQHWDSVLGIELKKREYEVNLPLPQLEINFAEDITLVNHNKC